MKNTVILYHKNCMDGNGAYYAAYKKYGDEAMYLAVNDRDNMPQELTHLYSQNQNNTEALKSVDVFVLDFCFSQEISLKLKNDFKKLIIIDHHISSQEDIKIASEYVYGTDKSGAYLSWEYFHPNTEIPLLIQYISDGDIWANQMPDYKKVLNYIHSPTTKDILTYLDEVSYDIENNFSKVLAIGDMLEDARNSRVNALLETKQKVNFMGYDVYAVNGNREMRSEVGHELAKLSGTFGIYFYISEGKLRVSLRSVKDFDVSVMAAKLGGGGHKNASAFDCDFDLQTIFDLQKSSK